MRCKPLAEYLAGRGRKTALARELKISPAAISQWDDVPTGRVLEVERLTGIPRQQLRPDLFREAA